MSRKTFMSLSKNECSIVSEACRKNSEEKLSDAKILAKNKSYGTATSLIILCLEEMVKALILSLDAKGFQIRQRVPKIKSVFENHRLRTFICLILSVFQIAIDDVKKMAEYIRDNPNMSLSDLNLSQNQIQEWLIDRLNLLQIEINWHSTMNDIRNRGLYVDYKNNLEMPQNVTPDEYFELEMRAENFLIVSNDFIKSFELEESPDYIAKHIKKTQSFLIEKDIYKKINSSIKELNVENLNILQDWKNKLEKVIFDIKKDGIIPVDIPLGSINIPSTNR